MPYTENIPKQKQDLERKIAQAVARLGEYGVEAAVEGPGGRLGRRPIDGILKITAPTGEPVMFFIDARRQLDKNTVGLAINERADEATLLLVDRLAPEAAQALREHRIPFLDAAGNTWLDLPHRLIWVEGRRPVEPVARNRPPRIFQAKGLEVVFALLVNPEWVGKTTRELAVVTGAANGTVAGVLNELADMGFAMRGPGKRAHRRLQNTGRLIDRWTEGYLQRLQPTTLLGRYRAAHPGTKWWEAVPPDALQAQLGGEPAAAAMTGYLKPQTITLYVEGNGAAAMIAGKLRPDLKGDVELRRKFWKFGPVEGEPENLVPPLLVYADLIGTGDARCIEAAQRIRKEHLARLELG